MVQDKHLKHMRQPDTPTERETSPSMTVDDFEALFLRRALLEHARYDRSELAEAYAQYLDTQIRENKKEHCDVYAHTDEAIVTLLTALSRATLSQKQLVEHLRFKVKEMEQEMEDEFVDSTSSQTGVGSDDVDFDYEIEL